MTADITNHIQQSLQKGIDKKVFEHAECIFAQSGQIVAHSKVGKMAQHEPLYFDLASLTKPLCTALTTLVLRQQKKIKLKTNVLDFFESKNLCDIQIKDLLNHTSGLIDWVPYYNDFIGHESPGPDRTKSLILNKILNDSKSQLPDKKTTYSDLGYILLSAILEKIESKTLDQIFKENITDKLDISSDLFFVPLGKKSTHNIKDFIPSENCPVRHKVIQAEVMDRNAYVLNGVSGHAGLFSNATAIHKILTELRDASQNQSRLFSQKSFERFCKPDPDRDATAPCFTLGFDTPTTGASQSGSLFSKNSIGHLGYAGTSFWWDLDKDLWVILLTNRCMPDRANFKIQQFRPEFHDSILASLAKEELPTD